MISAILFGYVPLAIWAYLLVGRGWFWLARERDHRDENSRHPAQWPSVAVVVPARNEADTIARALKSLMAQNYPGPFRVILIDDESEDETAEIAHKLERGDGLAILTGTKRPPGWTGKLWAVAQGTAYASDIKAADYLLITDADIVHAPDNLTHLVTRAEQGGLVLVSLMARLRCESPAELFLIPAFVYFFQMLYPFAWVNEPGANAAAAAGGCMLVSRAALEAAGGIAAIKGEIIDDCALGLLMKRQGPIWLGLTDRTVSIRPYSSIADIRRMIARSAYAELDYSPFALLGTLIGLALMFLTPLLWAAFGEGASRAAAMTALVLMALSFQPMLRFYGRSPLWGFVLPFTGFAYAGFTLDSALQHWRGRGGMWKGRSQGMARE